MKAPKNLIAYRFKPQRGLDDGLQDAFAAHVIRDPDSLELKTTGFCSPVSSDSDIVARRLGSCTVFAVAVRSRVIPGAVLSERAAARVRKRSEERGRPIGSAERREIRDEILTDMLATAFVKQSVTTAWLDVHHGWLVVDTSSGTRADAVVSQLREVFDSFRLISLRSMEAPSMIFADWLQSKMASDPFELANECLLVTSDGSTWAGKKVDLTSQEIAEHLSAGAHPERLGLSYRDRLGFVLDQDLVIRRLDLKQAVVDELSGEETGGDALAEFDATFTVVTADVAALLDSIAEVFDAEVVPDDEPLAQRMNVENGGEDEGEDDPEDLKADALTMW